MRLPNLTSAAIRPLNLLSRKGPFHSGYQKFWRYGKSIDKRTAHWLVMRGLARYVTDEQANGKVDTYLFITPKGQFLTECLLGEKEWSDWKDEVAA